MNYIIKHTGDKPVDLKKVTEIIRAHQGSLIDDSGMPSMALVRIESNQLESVKNELNDWHLYPQKSYPVPDTKKNTGEPFGRL